MLSKDCNLRDTRSGEIAVVVNHTVTEDEEGGQEMVTLMIFEAQAAGPAKVVSDFFAIEEPSAQEIQQKTSAMARAKLTTQPMNRHMLRHVHQEFMRDLLGRPGVGRAGARRTAEDISEEATVAKEIIGRNGRVLLQFREGDFEEFETHAVTVNAVEGMATKVALVFTRAGVIHRRVMDASRARSLLPADIVVIELTFISLNTCRILKKLTESNNAGDNHFSCREITLLAKAMRLSVPPLGIDAESARRSAGRAAISIDNAIESYLLQNGSLPQFPEEVLSVEAVAGRLVPLFGSSSRQQVNLGQMPESQVAHPKYPRAEAHCDKIRHIPR